ncbi:putative GDP-mannose 6-dehydrogenase [Sphingorhabdus sp. 109]|jgi:UDPglucose 6-dehydrogenase|nr:putative GDP-mannose 6-dehydrogenase [Sphingorhabdus sp. 109]
MEALKKHPTDSLSVIGLGKVGLPLAANLASAGSPVFGYDPDPVRRDLLSSHDPQQDEIFYENGLSHALKEGAVNLTAVDNMAEAILASAISFVIVPTPSLQNGSFSLSFVESVCSEIGKTLRSKAEDHLIVLVSTVSPASVADTIVPVLERASGKTCGKGFSFCYSPALIALGDVIKGFAEPDFAFVGEVDENGADQLNAFYSDRLPPETPIHRMSAESVEIAKLALNNFLTMKIGFSNLIGHLCDRTPNADVHDVLGALGNDTRIGGKFLNAGMGFGGPCLPRDNAALSASLSSVDLEPYLPEAIARSNMDHTTRLAMIADPHRNVGVIGLGYKAASPVTLDSAAIALCNILIERGRNVYAFDPLADKMDFGSLHEQVILVSSLSKLFELVEMAFLTADLQSSGEFAENFPDEVMLIDVSSRLANDERHSHVRIFGKS